MPRFHINPDNKALECTAAPGNCAFRKPGEPEMPHYPTAEIAYAATNKVQGESMKRSRGSWETKIPDLEYTNVTKQTSYEYLQIGDKINGCPIRSISEGRVNTTIMVWDEKKGRERKVYKPLTDKVTVERQVYTPESKEARDNALVELEFEKKVKNYVSKVPGHLRAMQARVEEGRPVDDFSTENLIVFTQQEKVHSEIMTIVEHHKREGSKQPYLDALGSAAERYSEDLLDDARRGVTPRDWNERALLSAKAKVVQAFKARSTAALDW